MMKKIFVYVVCALLLGAFCASITVQTARADELDDINKQIATLQQDLDSSKKATKPLEENLNSLKKQLAAIKANLAAIELNIARKEQEIARAEKALTTENKLLNERVSAHYKNLRKTGRTLIDLLVSSDFSTSLQNLFYQEKAADNDKQIILRIVLYIKNIDDAKKELAAEKIKLAATKVQVDKQSTFLADEVGKAKTYQSSLSQKIASLSARQQDLLAQKLGSLHLPTSLGFGALQCTDDRKLDPGFGAGFAFFTFGIPHRIGINQYGALGRAKANQGAEAILDAYFDNVELKKDYDTGITINVQGNGSFNIEDYVKHVYEMPESWPLEALKAQAIAARTYALNFTNNGAKEICTTQACQVFKSEAKTGAWAQAVDETRGWVLVQNGQPITAWYSSTDGGYTFRSADVGWSDRSWTKRLQDGDGGYGSFDDLFAHAYDRDSPCFYAAQGWRAEYNKSAWLKPSEVADIANVLMLSKADSGTQQHLSQPDKPNPDGVDTWDAGRVRDELKSRGISAFSSISDVSVSADFGVGQTTGVTVSGDAGSQTFGGPEWKNFFNLRAPANIQIVGGLFRAEKR